jgi:hypothetical protein
MGFFVPRPIAFSLLFPPPTFDNRNIQVTANYIFVNKLLAVGP